MAEKKQTSYRRLLLKLSGEALLGQRSAGIDPQACLTVAQFLCRIQASGFELGVVIGGGNFVRGIDLKNMGMSATPADQIGMLSTLINGIALQEALSLKGAAGCVMTALDCPRIAESYNWKKAQHYLEEKKILIFTGGTGNPYFTTDTAAALRASEIQADLLLKATKVDGIYTQDPLKNKNASKYETMTYSQLLMENLQVMDATAIVLCQNNRIPILVFNMQRLIDEPIEDILKKSHKGTWVET